MVKRDRIIDYVVEDMETGCTFVVDVFGDKYMFHRGEDINVTVSGMGIENFEYEEIYVQGYNLSNFPNNHSYHPIPSTTYVVQSDEILHITSLTAAQTKKGLSTIALYRDGVREREIPMIEDIHVTFSKPHRYYEGEQFQMKFKPSDKRTRIIVFVDGYVTEE